MKEVMYEQQNIPQQIWNIITPSQSILIYQYVGSVWVDLWQTVHGPDRSDMSRLCSLLDIREERLEQQSISSVLGYMDIGAT